MLEYDLDIQKRSVWIITTPSATARSMPFYLTETGLFYAESRFFTRRSGKAGHYLLYTKSGEGEMETGGETVPLPPGCAVLINCAGYHHYRTTAGTWVNFWIHLDGTGAPPYQDLLDGGAVRLLRPQAFEDTLEGLLEIASQADVVSAAQVSQALSSLLTDMVSARTGPDGKAGHIQHDGVRAAVEFIRENYQSPISIDDITRSAGLSKFHFVRVFTRYLGTTPYNYLIHYRINQSKRMLCTTGLPVAQIAARTGYPSESNFIQQFSRLSGMTPAQFRRQNISYRPQGE